MTRTFWIALLASLLALLAWWFTASTNNDSAPRLPVPEQLVQFDRDAGSTVFKGRGPGHWDAVIRERGWILRTEQEYRLWYSAHSGNKRDIKHMGYATSVDGVHWQRRAVPLAADHWIEDLMIVPHQGQYYLFAEGQGDKAQLLISDDGLDWQARGTLDVRQTNGEPIEFERFGTPTALHDNGFWYLFYEYKDLGVWVARSTDLNVWTNLTDDPVLLPGPDSYDARLIAMNQVVKRDGLYYAYYHGTGSKTKPAQWCTAVAVSKDLLQWQKYAGNPLVPCADNSASGIVVATDSGVALYTMHDQVVRYPPLETR